MASSSWYHYIPERVVTVSDNKQSLSTSRTISSSSSTTSNTVNPSQDVQPQQHRQEEQQQDCFRSKSPSVVEVSSPSISLLLPEKYDASLEILRTLSSESMQASIQKSRSTDPACDGSLRAAETVEAASQIPCRNLTKDFEQMYIQPNVSSLKDSETPLVKQPSNPTSNASVIANKLISPTGVADLPISTTCVDTPISKQDVVGKLDEKLGFHLHPSLQRDLSDALIQRVSFYTVIHDINKEANSMAANDDSGFNRPSEEVSEEYDPIVVAVQGYPKNRINGTSSMADIALIDEEEWILDAINGRSSGDSSSVNACPPTFSQAMGERDYENPLTSLSNGSRTQLWKPSRSWWEAKSGKNPWIEPKNHNKRWRYLWPLIHYHKFLAKCIKKLKRNGVDVKTSVSPVAVFLREEVCAVSDHLASVSLFDSDQWMTCLEHFHGWIESSTAAQKQSQEMVSKLKLRPLTEAGDVDSPLLRSQIDKQYLQAMANAREQLSGIGTELRQEDSRPRDSLRRRDSHSKSKSPSIESLSSNPGSVHGRSGSTPGFKTQLSTPNIPIRWHGYGHHPVWWQGGWSHPAYPYADDTSVHSALSGDTSLSHAYGHGFHPGAVTHHSPYYPPMMYSYPHMMHGHQYELGSIPDGSEYTSPEIYGPQHMTPGSWMGHPHVGYPTHATNVPETSGGVPSTPSRNVTLNDKQDHQVVGEEKFDPHSTPYKYSPSHFPTSPYWAHLQDHATLSMMGLATPQTSSAPETPHQGATDLTSGSEAGSEDELKNTVNAQPLLLRQPYYGYGQYNPPSPASQFLMTPREQPNLGYSYAYGTPRQSQGYKKRATVGSEEVNDARNDVSEGGKTTSASTSPLRPASKNTRESPIKTEGVVSE